MTELQWTAKLTKYLRQQCGAMVIPYPQGKFSHPGVPDRFICHPLWAGWLEMKGQKTRLQANQVVCMQRLNRAVPGLAFVVRQGTVSKAIRIEDEQGDLRAICVWFNLLEILARATKNARSAQHAVPVPERQEV